MTDYVVDACAWIEYFNGSDKGAAVRAIVESEKNKIVTNVITIAEISSYFHKKGKEFSEAKKIIFALSTTFSPGAEFAAEAGALYVELRKNRKHIGLADVFVLLTARRVHAKVLTADQDFKGLKEVVLLK